MTLSQDTLSILTIAALVVAVAALAVALSLGRRLYQVRRSYSARQRQSAAHPPAAGGDDDLSYELAEVRDVLAHAIQRIGMVRFDAFEDMGGKLSFAVALLDADGSGVVFSSINGRTETRIYAKPIERGASRIQLSGEEIEAIRRALGAVHA